MKKSFLFLLIACIAVSAAVSMPSQYDDDSDGWVGLYLFYSYPLGGGSPTYGLEVRGAGVGDLGIDFQIMGGGICGLSLGATYFYNPSGPSLYTIPLTASLGYFMSGRALGSGAFDRSGGSKDMGVGLELSGGVDVYALGGVYDTENDESAYLELGGRLAAYWFGWGARFEAEGLAGGSWSIAPDTGDDGDYYYYYD
jgi:hypothetical protein